MGIPKKEKEYIIKEILSLYMNTKKIKENIVLSISSCLKTKYALLNKNWLENYKIIHNYSILQNHIEKNYPNLNENSLLENLLKDLDEEYFVKVINGRNNLFNLENNCFLIEEKTENKSNSKYPYNFVLVSEDFLNKIKNKHKNFAEIKNYFYETIVGEQCIIMNKNGFETYYISLFNDKNIDYFYNNYTDYIMKFNKGVFISFVMNNIKGKTFFNFLDSSYLNENNNVLKNQQGKQIGHIYLISNNHQQNENKSSTVNNANFVKDNNGFFLNNNFINDIYRTVCSKKKNFKKLKMLGNNENIYLYINSILLCLYNIFEFKELIVNNNKNNHGKLFNQLYDIFMDFKDKTKRKFRK